MKFLLKNPANKKKLFACAGSAVVLGITVVVTAAVFTFLHGRAVPEENFAGAFSPHPFYPASLVYLFILYIFEMYEVRKRYGGVHVLTSLILAASLSFFVMCATVKVLRINLLTITALFFFFIVSVPMLYVWQRVFRRFFLTKNLFVKRLLFLETDILTVDILSELKNRDYKVVGLVSEHGFSGGHSPGALCLLGGYASLGDIMRSEKPDVIVRAHGATLPFEITREMYKYTLKGIEVHDSNYFYELLTRKVAITEHLDVGRYVPSPADVSTQPVFSKIKRSLDVLGAMVLLVAFSPLLVIISLLILIMSGRPVFYLQERIGYREEPFTLIKFRTMVRGAESVHGPQWASKNDSRVTSLGRLLRRTRLDELPQVFNILKGDMSFVGPRPFRKYFVDMFEKEIPFYSLKFNIKPGLTGWAQVNHKYRGEQQTLQDNIDRLQYDLYYMAHASLFLDLFIILKTLQTLVRRPAY